MRINTSCTDAKYQADRASLENQSRGNSEILADLVSDGGSHCYIIGRCHVAVIHQFSVH